jgi:hypothetical protein
MQPTSLSAFTASFNSPEPTQRISCSLQRRRFVLTLVLTGWVVSVLRPAPGQVILSPSAAPTNHTPTLALSGNPKSFTNQSTNHLTLEQQSEQIRTACINGRRHICGRVLQIVPQGLVVESGYTNLLRPELSRSWVAPGNVSATLPPNLVEGQTPGAICVGMVLVTDIPKRPAVKLYDYVILEAYPAGKYVYQPVPSVTKTIRRFSVGLLTAIKLNFDAGEK